MEWEATPPANANSWIRPWRTVYRGTLPCHANDCVLTGCSSRLEL